MAGQSGWLMDEEPDREENWGQTKNCSPRSFLLKCYPSLKGYSSLFSRPGQSQGMLYDHHHHSIINFLTAEPFSSPRFYDVVKTKLLGIVSSVKKLPMFHRSRISFISESIKIEALVQKLCQFCWIGGLCLLLELQRKGSLPVACAEGCSLGENSIKQTQLHRFKMQTLSDTTPPMQWAKSNNSNKLL